MHSEKKAEGPSTQFNQRVSGAEQNARALARRVEAFLAELARPPDPPPWSPPPTTTPDTGQSEEIERLRRLLQGSQKHAIMAENRADMAEEQLEALQAFCSRLEAELRASAERTSDAISRAEHAEGELLEAHAELARLRPPPANDVTPTGDVVVSIERFASGAHDSPTERKARHDLADLLYP